MPGKLVRTDSTRSDAGKGEMGGEFQLMKLSDLPFSDGEGLSFLFLSFLFLCVHVCNFVLDANP